jgi:signal transduction histidine kinase
MTRALRLTLFPAGVALGLFAEWASLRRGPLEEAVSASDLRLAAADLAVGLVLIACGLVAWERRPESWTGILLTLAGFTWFLGTFSGSSDQSYADFGSLFVTLHRGPIVHALLGYPSGRPVRRLERAAIAIGYVLAAVAAIGNTAVGTVFLAGLVLAVAGGRWLVSSGPQRRARVVGAGAAAAFSAVLLVSGTAQWAGAAASTDRSILWAYQIVLAGIAATLLLDLLLRRWTAATVTGLIVDLGELGETAPLRDRLATALGDPSLVVGYHLPERDVYVDELGRELELPDEQAERSVTIVRDGDDPVAALIHDSGAVSDPELLDSVASAARIAVANARLQAEVRRQLEEIEASRRRIVETGDAQRRRLEAELRLGAERRLEEVEALLPDNGGGSDSSFAAMLAETKAELERARKELREFARGVHPRVLTEGGLPLALRELRERSPVSVALEVPDERYAAPVEATAYFVCSEGLANVAKYAEASRAEVEVSAQDGRLVVIVRDDGRGGASLDAGSGLRGLADRVEAVGGTLRLESPPGEGTVLVAELPLN